MEPHEQHDLTPQTEQEDFVSAPNVVRTDKTLIVKDFFIANDTEVQMLKGQKFARYVVSSASVNTSVYSTAANQYLIGVTSLAIAPTIGLPPPKLVGAGKTFIIKDEVGGAATTTITIVSQAEETIDGASSTTLTSNYQSKSFYTDGANWFIF